MYGISTTIGPKNHPNLGEYNIPAPRSLWERALSLWAPACSGTVRWPPPGSWLGCQPWNLDTPVSSNMAGWKIHEHPPRNGGWFRSENHWSMISMVHFPAMFIEIQTLDAGRPCAKQTDSMLTSHPARCGFNLRGISRRHAQSSRPSTWTTIPSRKCPGTHCCSCYWFYTQRLAEENTSFERGAKCQNAAIRTTQATATLLLPSIAVLHGLWCMRRTPRASHQKSGLQNELTSIAVAGTVPVQYWF